MTPMMERNTLLDNLSALNYRRTADALAMWQGDAATVNPNRLYEEYAPFLRLKTLNRIDREFKGISRQKVRHAFIDHYLQHALLPHETEMQTWMRGAAAVVNGQRIGFGNIIHWCQKACTHADRENLQKETGPLCKFFKPFALNYWEILLDILKNELGFDTYLAYCGDKKGIDYDFFCHELQRLLDETGPLYFNAMQAWVQNSFDLPLERLNRFDAIHLFGMRAFNGLFPGDALDHARTFLRKWRIDLDALEGLHLHTEKNDRKSDQAMSFLLRIPGDVHLVINPVGGWIDLETIWHELGHGLSAALTSPELPFIDRELATSYSLSESFAFLIQNIGLSLPFLRQFLDIPREEAHRLYYYKTLKDLALFRRYAAKLIAEHRMFHTGELADGEPYATTMQRHTGFYHQPESHLFDLVPEFYCLDYLLGWMGEAAMEAHLREHFGEAWMFSPGAGSRLKQWWLQGNRLDIFAFFEFNALGPLHADLLIKRWERVLGDRSK